MIERVIEWSIKNPLTVYGIVGTLTLLSFVAIARTPLDAIPDLSDPQVIVFTEWMGRSPDLVEDQITYPLVRALRSTPGGVDVVRGYSMFGMSFVYVVFHEGTDLYWGRTRVSERLASVELPDGVTPRLGPDATGLGWIYEYVLEDTSGTHDLAELRTLQEYTIAPSLRAVDGVSEIASIGGFQRQYQVIVDPDRLATFGLSVGDVSRAVADSNSEVGARVLESAGQELILRGRGYVHSLEDVETSVVAIGPGGTPIRVRDVARVAFGPEIRRGAADWNGQGEVVGGVVVMRMGENALHVIEDVQARIDELPLPDGVRIVPTYDRSELILGSIDTLTMTLLEEMIIVALVAFFFLFHLRSGLVAIITMPLAALMAFIPMAFLGLTANIMTLGGIAISVSELEDASTTLVENASSRFAAAGPGADRKAIIIATCREVGRPVFYSMLLLSASCIPILVLTGESGRLFRPLIVTFIFATLIASVLSITLIPPLMVLLLRGTFRTDANNPVAHTLTRLYRPIARLAVRWRWVVITGALLIVIGTIPAALRLGSEFMPPLDEGALLVMPTTFNGISIESGREVMQRQDAIIASFAEVRSVFGKIGRADTPTDPAQLDMTEIVVELRPREEWPLLPHERWWSSRAPSWMAPALRLVWPDARARTTHELSNDIAAAVQTPGYQIAVSPPIRTRVDMLSTGVRTPVGIRVYGEDLASIETVSVQLEAMLRDVPGTRSTFAERQSGRGYVDVIPNREAIARYGLTVREVNDVVEAAIGGMSVSTIVDGRARYSMNVRFGADFRSDPEALRSILVPVRTSSSVADVGGDARGAGVDPVSGGGGGAMGSGSAMGAATSAAAPVTAGSPEGGDVTDRFRMPRPAVPLGELAEVRVTTGPPMIRDEDGVLVGFVYADVDLAQRDLGGWVDEAKRLVHDRLVVPPGIRLAWTGQYEQMQEMESRMMWAVPLSLVLVIWMVRRGMRGWGQLLLVLTGIPFALVGSVWLFVFAGYNLSTAVWVGLIDMVGNVLETGILMTEYLDGSVSKLVSSKMHITKANLDEAIVDGASRRIRGLVMSVASTVLGLLPLLWEAGPGADVNARTAAPIVGGLWTCMILTMLVLPGIYSIWRQWQLRHGRLAASIGD